MVGSAVAALPAHLVQRATSSPAPPGIEGVINPVAFGADPTGRKDSTQAMYKAVAALLQLGQRSRSTLSSNITDLAGAVLDLQGGEYLLSSPIMIPQFFGNFYITGGTLRASSAFPADGYLVTIGATGCHPDYAASCNEFIGLSNLLLDSNHKAAGAINIISAMGVTVGPGVFVERFAKIGIKVDGGHETMVHETWLVETYWNNLPPEANQPSARVHLDGCDGSASQKW